MLSAFEILEVTMFLGVGSAVFLLPSTVGHLESMKTLYSGKFLNLYLKF